MKILYYSAHPNLPLSSRSGPGTHMREVISAWEKDGHEVKHLIMGGNELTAQASSIAPRKTLKSRVKPWIPKLIWETLKDRSLRKFDQHCAQELRRACESFQPDIIYERGYFNMLSGVQVAEEFKIFHALEMNAPYPEEKAAMEGKGLFHQKSVEAEQQQCEKTQLLVVVSSALKQYFVERTGIPAGKVLITPNAVNLNYLPSTSKASEIRASFSWSEHDLVFGFVGSIFPYHGVDKLIEAFALLKATNKRLLIVGDGALLNTYKARVTELGLNDRVRFTGAVDHREVYQYIDAMDITVMADSNWYGSPVKIFEYGAMKKALIAPNTIPVLDVMIDGVDGKLCSNEMPEILAALSQMQEDEAFRNELAESWHQKVLERHTWREVSRSILHEITKQITA
jgi:glycosyltransferase involved in cell wall biosynthesis